jgi:two-component sensor histidine kinase
MDAEELLLDFDRALTCGLIVNELVCNALKHAFPPGREGEIRLAVRAADGQCELTVADDGRGLPPDFSPERAASLGMNLVVTLVKQLQGRLSIANQGGTQIRITFPMGTAVQPATVP